MRDPRLACKFEALALALRAKMQPLGPAEVAVLARMSEALPPDDLLRGSTQRFLTFWQTNRRDGDAMFGAGCTLIRDIERAGWPDHVLGAA